MRKKNKGKESGITLVALVVTIIIIIILATVAISFTFGNNGLIKRAEDARKYYTNDTKYTEGSIANVESYINSIILNEEGDSQEPEEQQTVIEITETSWDLALLSEEEKNINGYYLIKNDCIILDSSESASISSTGEKVLQVGDNVNCEIQSGTFKGKIMLGNNLTLKIQGGIFEGEIELKNANLEVYDGTFKRSVNGLDGSNGNIYGGTFNENIVSGTNGSIQVNGGTFVGNIIVEKSGNMKISGGTVIGQLNVDSDGTLLISGGAFQYSPEEYVDSRHRVEQYNQQGCNYIVVEIGAEG